MYCDSISMVQSDNLSPLNLISYTSSSTGASAEESVSAFELDFFFLAGGAFPSSLLLSSVCTLAAFSCNSSMDFLCDLDFPVFLISLLGMSVVKVHVC